jgi:cytochrome oxidase Cu insertion factor (SCO1/SenC/PrrC family)
VAWGEPAREPLAVSAKTHNADPDAKQLADSERGASQGSSAERFIWGALGIVVLVVVAAGLWSVSEETGAPSSEDLPVLGRLPDFSLVERSGRPLTRDDLAGRVWVANFIFTSCRGVCPLLSSRMAKLRESLADIDPSVMSVSLSVDPTRDSPDVLRGYAERSGADPNDWLFATGDYAEVHRLIGEGFRLSVAEQSPEEAGESGELITHSDRFVLVDEDSQIRGYYHGSESEVLTGLKDDIRRLKRGG